MGRFGFQPEDGVEPVETEVFGALKGAYQNQKYGHEVFETIINWYFKILPNTPLRALSMKENKASQTLLEKSPFKKLIDQEGNPITTIGWGKVYEVFEYPIQ
ncbi:MAG: GNAT family N-acetyltransferase [Alphaproteobacteria bacterium]